MKPYFLNIISRCPACFAAVIGLLSLASPAGAYIDRPENHTLPRLLLQMSPVVVLKVERVDLAKGAVAFQVTDWIQGKEGDEGINGTIKHALLMEGKLPKGLERLKVGQTAVFFAVDQTYDKSRAVMFVEGVWYQAGRTKDAPSWWHLFTTLNNRLDPWFSGSAAELADALKKLRAGQEVIVKGREKVPGAAKLESYQVSYSMKRPHTAFRLSDSLLAMPANTWTHLKTSRNPAASPGLGIGGALGNGRIQYLADHKSIVGEWYEIVANTWSRTRGSADWKPVPLPLPRYQYACYLPGHIRFFSVFPGGAYLDHPYAEDCGWVGQAAYSRTAPKAGGADAKAVVSYDLQLHAPIYIVNSGATGVYVAYFWKDGVKPHENPRGGVMSSGGSTFIVDGDSENSRGWSKKWPMPKEMEGANIHAAYDEARKLHVVWTGKEGSRWWTFNSANGQWKKLADLETARRAAGHDDDPYPENSLSLAYDVENQLTVAAVKGKKRGVLELWAHDAENDAWKPLALKGDLPPGTPAWNQLVYDPNHKCFFFLNVLMAADGRTGRTDGFFVFRHQSEAKKAQ